jgi:hypothetical protein
MSVPLPWNAALSIGGAPRATRDPDHIADEIRTPLSINGQRAVPKTGIRAG